MLAVNNANLIESVDRRTQTSVDRKNLVFDNGTTKREVIENCMRGGDGVYDIHICGTTMSEMYIPFRRWVETILWILCRGLKSTSGIMLYQHMGVLIFNSIQTNVGQIYLHYLEWSIQ